MENITWTKEDYDEYNRQLKLINDAYGELPEGRAEHIAAEIVNKKKAMLNQITVEQQTYTGTTNSNL